MKKLLLRNAGIVAFVIALCGFIFVVFDKDIFATICICISLILFIVFLVTTPFSSKEERNKELYNASFCLFFISFLFISLVFVGDIHTISRIIFGINSFISLIAGIVFLNKYK